MNRVTFTKEAKADIRGIEQRQALVILKAIDRLSKFGIGDIQKLEDDARARYRLRVGDWRVFFRFGDRSAVHVVGAENRKDAY